MNINIHKNIIGFLKIVSIVFFLSFLSSAEALTISPAKIELTGDPGATVSGEFLIMNEQGNQMTFYTSAENFEAQGESGVPSFKNDGTGLASWINVESSFSLINGQQTVVPFTVKIPTNADAGGYFSAIFLSTTPPDIKGGQVSVGAKIGVLVFLRVSGDIKEGGGVVEFNTKDKSRFYSSLPVSFEYRFSNDGGDRVRPSGTVLIKNILGWKKTEFSANPGQGNVLPKSIRKFEISWGDSSDDTSKMNFLRKAIYELKHFAFGVYKVSLVLDNKNIIDSNISSLYLFMIPWHFLIVFVLGLLLVIWIFVKMISKYNKWIISKAIKKNE